MITAKAFRRRNISCSRRMASAERESTGGWRRMGTNAAKEVRRGTNAFKRR